MRNRTLALALALLASCSPDSAPNAPTPPATAPRPAGAVLAFDAPKEWVREEPENNMRKAQYRVPDRQKQAKDASFVLSTTRAGGPEDVERWSAQMGGAQAKTETIEGKNKITLVDLSGDYRSDFDPNPVPNARMLIGVVDLADRPWFFKLVGPIETVSGWRDEFVAMVKAAASR